MFSKIKRNVAIFVLLSFFICAAVLKIYEPVSSANFSVNMLKRIAAEMAAGLVRIYDPYLTQRKTASLGPAFSKENVAEANVDSGFFSLSLLSRQHNERIRVIKYDNKEVFMSRFRFDYQTSDEPKLKILREKYELNAVLKEGSTEFEKQLLLMNWLRQRWEAGESKNISYNFDAIDVLERALKGERFFCSEYATTYVQLLSAIGMTARYVGLFKGHVVVEVWSNLFDKWIIMDPYFNIYYERFGVPLNALELHKAWISGNWKYIRAVKGKHQVPEEVAIDSYKYKMIDYYENFYVRMRNDWLTNRYPHWYPEANSIMNGVEWVDTETKNNILVANETSDPNDLYWPLNHVSVVCARHFVSGSKNTLRLYMKTVTPNFDMFIIRIDNHAENESVVPIIDWDLHPGVNTIEIYSLNKSEVKGPVTTIQLDCKF